MNENNNYTDSELQDISGRTGYDILIGTNNGEEIRRAFQTKPWKSDYEIYNPDQEPGPEPGPEPITPPKDDGNLTFLALVDNSTVCLKSTQFSLEYSLDSDTWEEYTGNTVITLNKAGNYVKFRGDNSIVNFSQGDGFMMTGSIAASGDVTSLMHSGGGDISLYGNSNLSYLFYECTSLVTPPNLPSTNINTECYSNMFYGCTSLTTALELPATDLSYATGCYYCMFTNCSSLTTAPSLPSTNLGFQCYSNMFSGCTSLVEAPELPAVNLVEGCYSYMFYGCSSLNHVKAWFVQPEPGDYGISYNSYLSNWLNNVAEEGTIEVRNDLDTSELESVVPDTWTFSGFDPNEEA